jgi:PRTRC genetic system ThiF family protein
VTAPLRKQHIAPQIHRVIMVGVGGTGSYLAQGLAKIIAGYRLKLQVILVDPDIIEEKNCARQNFHPWEIGHNKAEALAFRLNQQYGISFAAVVGKGEEYDPPGRSSYKTVKVEDMSRLIITCVDTIAARKHYKECGPWLDLGNGLETGQAIYGTKPDKRSISDEFQLWEKRPSAGRLPNPWMLSGMARLKDKKTQTISCADTPFAEQGCFINELAAQAGLIILHQLLVKGAVTTPAIYFNSANGRMVPEYITRDYLSRSYTKEN